MIWFSKLNIERLLALLHKITGWTILGYLIVHVIFVNRLAHGESTEPEIFKYFLALIGSIVAFHVMNGIRIILYRNWAFNSQAPYGRTLDLL
jgi:succinate dehydrogenase/fumarate reductase cytochrome b subunit